MNMPRFMFPKVSTTAMDGTIKFKNENEHFCNEPKCTYRIYLN